MRTRFSSQPTMRSLHTAPTVTSESASADLSALRPFGRAGFGAAKRLTLALAMSAPFCAGALLANPAQAAPTVESDENGPIVQILKPGYNDILKGNYRILIQVTARKYNPQSVEMFIDDVSATPGPLEISSFASSSYNFDTRLMTDGRHKLTVRVTDSQGFRGWSEVTVFVNNKGIVDDQAPQLDWKGIEPFKEYSGPMKIEVDAADNFGVKMIQISINPADSPNKPAYSWMMNQPPYRVNLDTIGKNIPDGLYILKAKGFDSLDQQGEAKPLTIGILNNAINATRVGEMLDGQRQMADLLKSEKPAEVATAKSATAKTSAPAKAAATPDKVTATAPVAAPAPEAATARSSQPAPQTRAVPQNAPTLNIPQQTASNPGIQLPRVNVPAAQTPAATEPTRIAETRIAETPIAETPTPEVDSTLTEVVPNIAVDAGVDAAPTEVEAATDASANTTETPAPTNQTQAAPTETLPAQTNVATEKVLVAALPGAPIGRRNAGEASLSRAAAVNLAMTASSQVATVAASNTRSMAPIEVARFGQPRLPGRMVSDAPVWSQHPQSDESRLSNAELVRTRANKTRVLSAARSINAGIATAPSSARMLQTSAPTLSERPILSRTISPETLTAPASKLTRQVQKQSAPLAKNAPGAGTFSKAVPVTQRALPIAPHMERLAPAPVAAFAKTNTQGATDKAAELEVAPTFIAKNTAKPAAQAPQMSAMSAPRMSESASGLGVPSKLSKAVTRLAGKQQSASTPAATRVESRNGERIAALPRPGAVNRQQSGGAAIVAIPLNEPLQVADPTIMPVPATYRAEHTTTLRAIAARFGLPVELVAISNGWTSEMKVTRGMEVKLPRPLDISYNGVPVKGDAPSMLAGDTAVTAFRFMFEKSGGKLRWDATNQRVIATKDGREIVLTIGSDVAKVGDREVMMEIAAFLFQGRAMVPLRFFEEGLNAQVEWNPQTGRLVVAMAG